MEKPADGLTADKQRCATRLQAMGQIPCARIDCSPPFDAGKRYPAGTSTSTNVRVDEAEQLAMLGLLWGVTVGGYGVWVTVTAY
jgi:hypothetical protein